jgi:hypothetical protein
MVRVVAWAERVKPSSEKAKTKQRPIPFHEKDLFIALFLIVVWCRALDVAACLGPGEWI